MHHLRAQSRFTFRAPACRVRKLDRNNKKKGEVTCAARERFRNTQRATVTVPAGLRLATRQADAFKTTSKAPRVTTAKSRKDHTDDPKLHEFTLAIACTQLPSAKVTRDRASHTTSTSESNWVQLMNKQKAIDGTTIHISQNINKN